MINLDWRNIFQKILCFLNIKHYWTPWHIGQWSKQMDIVYGQYHLYSNCYKCNKGKWIKVKNIEGKL